MKSVIQENFPKMKDNVKVYIERAHSISEKNWPKRAETYSSKTTVSF